MNTPNTRFATVLVEVTLQDGGPVTAEDIRKAHVHFWTTDKAQTARYLLRARAVLTPAPLPVLTAGGRTS